MKTCRICSVAAALALSSAATLFAQIPLVTTPPDQRTPAQLRLLPKAIDAHAMTEHVAVGVLANLPHEVALRVELEIARLLRAGVDEDVPLGVSGHSDAFAHVHVGRQLHEVLHDFVLDVGRIYGLGQQSRGGGREGDAARGDRRGLSSATSRGLTLDRHGDGR